MTTWTRRDVLRAGIGAGLTGLLAGCGDDGTASTPDSAARRSTGTGAATASTSTPATSATATMAPSAVEALRRTLSGTVITPTDGSFASAGLSANGRYLDPRPAVIAQCADEADVVACVKWATANGVPLVGRGGGHSYAGLSTTNGLLMDLGRLNKVQIDTAAGVATVQGAALNQDVLDASYGGRFVLPGGTCLTVGTGGLVLGGGIGYNAHWAGLTCDHLRATRIVTATGDILEIDDTNDPDLFWACRGGTGGNFGINTSFTFQLSEAPTEPITYFRYDFRGADAAAAMLAEYNRLCVTAPAAFSSDAMAGAVPVGTGGPREAIDAFVRGQYIGPEDELRDLMAPLLAAAGPPTTTAVNPADYWQVQRDVWASPAPAPHSFGDISRYAAEAVPDDVVAAVVELVAQSPSRTVDANGSFWSLGWVGGDVINSVGRTDTAYVHRGVSTLLRPSPVWPNDAPGGVGDDLIAWSEAVIDLIEPHTPNESYQNFPNRLLRDPLQQYFGENLPRLIDVKTRYDPTNVFTNEQGIPVG